MNREFQQYRFARIEAQNITRAQLEAQFKNGIDVLVQTNFFPHVGRAGAGQQRFRSQNIAVVFEHLGGQLRGLHRAPVRAGDDQRGTDGRVIAGSFQHGAEFAAPLAGDGAFGILRRRTFFGDRVTKQVDVHYTTAYRECHTRF